MGRAFSARLLKPATKPLLYCSITSSMSAFEVNTSSFASTSLIIFSSNAVGFIGGKRSARIFPRQDDDMGSS